MRLRRIADLLIQEESYSLEAKIVKETMQNLTTDLQQMPTRYKELWEKQACSIEDALVHLQNCFNTLPDDLSRPEMSDVLTVLNDKRLGTFLDSVKDKALGSEVKEVRQSTQHIMDELSKDINRDKTSPVVGEDKSDEKTGKKQILLADDQLIMAQIVRTILEPKGYKIYHARNGEEALQKARFLKPKLILMDINMPRKNGLQTLQEIKSKPETVNIPVMMLTGHAEKNHIKQALQLGSDDYLVKPVSAEILINKVKALLN